MSTTLKELEDFWYECRDDSEGDWQIHTLRYDLRDGDIQASKKLLEAASQCRWQEVADLLKSGADPRICRYCNLVGAAVSSLAFAICAGEYDIACELYKAGDRLDDYKCEEGEYLIQAFNEGKKRQPRNYFHDGMTFLAYKMRCGFNYFEDESKPLSECMGSNNYVRFMELLETTEPSMEEKKLAVMMFFFPGCFHQPVAEMRLEMLEALIKTGVDIADVREELLQKIADYRPVWEKTPTVIAMKKETLDRLEELIRNA